MTTPSAKTVPAPSAPIAPLPAAAAPGKPDIAMSAQQFERLAAIIYERSGIHFQAAKKYVLESRLARRLIELEIDDYDQYISFLTIGPYRDDEFQEMFNKITINETSFFRNEPQLDHFERVVLPQLLERRASTKRLRIWSSASSTGEEAYTLAIQVHRTLGIRLADWRIEILGTDISEKALDTAASGVYSQYAIRSTPPTVCKRYFKQEGQSWTLDPTVKSMASFQTLNLKDRLGAKRFGTWDVIFCRNVLIYFDDAMRTQVVNMFADQLAPDGYLYLGHSETLRGLNTPFEQLNAPQAFCYQRRSPNPSPLPAATASAQPPSLTLTSAPNPARPASHPASA